MRILRDPAVGSVNRALSFAVSVALWFDRERGFFVGLWVPSILCAGNLLLAGEESRP